MVFIFSQSRNFSGLKLWLYWSIQWCPASRSSLIGDPVCLTGCPNVSVPQPPTLNTGSLSACIPLGSAAIQRLDYAPCCCNKTTTFFSACWSPSGPASHRTGRRLPALSSPRPSRHTGTTPCFPSENHIRLCPLPLELLPSGFPNTNIQVEWGQQWRGPVAD